MDIPITKIEISQIEKEQEIKVSDYLFFYMLSGKLQTDLHNNVITLEKDDFAFLLPGSRHIFFAAEYGHVLQLNISSGFIEDHLNPQHLKDLWSVLHPETDFLNLKRLILNTAQLYESSESDFSCAIMGNLYLILQELQHYGQNFFSSSLDASSHSQILAREISDFIDSHIDESLSLSLVADAFFLTPQYLSVFFKKNFSEGFKDYVTRKKLFYSLCDLREGRLSVHEIALKYGFSSDTSYRRGFEKSYHMTPSAFRAEKRKTQNNAQEPGHVPAPKMSKSLLDSSIHQNVKISVQGPSQNLSRKDLILNIGQVQNLLSESYCRMLVSVNRIFRFPYIRIMGVVTSAFIPRILPDYSYNFQNLDKILNFLHANNLIPFIELSRESFHFLYRNDSDRMEQYYVRRNERWYQLFEQFLLHVSHRWTPAWLSKWKFELWIQPSESAEGYVQDFKRIRKILHFYIPDAAFGGPGYHECSAPVSANVILSEFRRQSVQPDFFSVYLDFRKLVPASAGTKHISLSMDPDEPVFHLRKIKDTVRKNIPSLPVYATEWESVCLPDIPVAYSRFQASFVIRMLKGLQKYSDMNGYWLLADTAAVPDTGIRLLYPTVQGLINVESRPVASYYAYRMFHEIGPNILAEGENYLFSKWEDHHYRLIVFHYEHFRAASDPMVQAETDFDRIYSLFEESPALYCSFHLTHMKPGIYHLQRFLLDDYHGSPLDIMIGEYRHSNIEKAEFLQKMKNISRFEQQYLLRTTVPEYRSIYTSVGEELSFGVSLPSHTVCLFDIRLQV